MIVALSVKIMGCCKTLCCAKESIVFEAMFPEAYIRMDIEVPLPWLIFPTRWVVMPKVHYLREWRKGCRIVKWVVLGAWLMWMPSALICFIMTSIGAIIEAKLWSLWRSYSCSRSILILRIFFCWPSSQLLLSKWWTTSFDLIGFFPRS